MENIEFENFCQKILYKSIIEWDSNVIILDDGTKITIEETAQDCCAHAFGSFQDVKLNAVITNISEIKYSPWEDGDTYGCSAEVTFLHDRNPICKAIADSDAGNGGYYFSVASFILKQKGEKEFVCHFVESGDN